MLEKIQKTTLSACGDEGLKQRFVVESCGNAKLRYERCPTGMSQAIKEATPGWKKKQTKYAPWVAPSNMTIKQLKCKAALFPHNGSLEPQWVCGHTWMVYWWFRWPFNSPHFRVTQVLFVTALVNALLSTWPLKFRVFDQRPRRPCEHFFQNTMSLFLWSNHQLHVAYPAINDTRRLMTLHAASLSRKEGQVRSYGPAVMAVSLNMDGLP